ncbi:hypothetical protein ACQ4PT_058181 [Festuca glaucescens]
MMSSKLYLAICGGRLNEEAMALLDADHVAGKYKVSAERNNFLHLAAEQGHAKLIRELYTRFGDSSLFSSQNSALDTPLHCAVRAGHGNAVTVLVELAWDSGDDSVLGCKNEAGETALHLAAKLGHAAAVEAMVSKAPNLASEVNYAGVSPLYLAVMSRSVPAVRAITTSCSDASAAGPSSQNALHAAVFQGKEMVGLLLNWNPSLASEAEDSGSTPLHFASSDGDSSIVGAILRAVPPCTVRMRDSGGLSALHIAAGMGHDGVAKALMKACPEAAELRDDRGGTFLHAAARGGHLEVVSLATKKAILGHSHLSRGLLNSQDRDGNTPLHLAVAARAPRVAENLLWTGKVRADVMNNDGDTPLDLSARSTSFFSMLGLMVTLAAFKGQTRPQRQDHAEKWNGYGITKGMEKTSDNLAVVAVLIATVAFTATNNVPGAYEQADDDTHGKMFFKGMAVLQRKDLFKCFIVLDSFALVTSVFAVILLIFGKASRSAGSWKTFAVALHCLWASLISIIVAFYAALSAVTTTRAVSIIAYAIIYYGFAVLYYTVYNLIAPPVSLCTVWKVIWRKGRNSVFTGRIRQQQYPVASAYAINLLVFKTIANLGFIGAFAISFLSEQAKIQARQSGAPAPSSLLT